MRRRGGATAMGRASVAMGRASVATGRASVGRRWHHRRVDGSGAVAIGGAPARVVARMRDRAEWKFFAVLPRAHRRLAAAWWLILLLRAALPAVFAVAMGTL